jgi:hypothetical protein
MTKTRFCERCGNQIPASRLEILPDTVICVGCSKAIGGEYEVRVSQENLSKTNSLKKNYGGINVRKTRKRIERIDPAQAENEG